MKKKLINKLKKIKKIKINLDKLDIKDDLISLMPNNTSIIDNIIKQIKKDVLKLPRSGFHLSLVYKRRFKENKKIGNKKKLLHLLNYQKLLK